MGEEEEKRWDVLYACQYPQILELGDKNYHLKQKDINIFDGLEMQTALKIKSIKSVCGRMVGKKWKYSHLSLLLLEN